MVVWCISLAEYQLIGVRDCGTLVKIKAHVVKPACLHDENIIGAHRQPERVQITNHGWKSWVITMWILVY